MQTPASSLPEAWVKKIFSTMRVTYGASFDRQWECPAGQDAAEHASSMLAHWGTQLGPYANHPEALAYALENLPDFPPSLIEFRNLCRRAPDKKTPLLEAPKVTPAEMLAAVATIAKPEPKEDPKQWARDLQQRDKNGAALTQAQRAMYRAALANDYGSGRESFNPGGVISPDALPPGMRGAR